MLDYLCTNTQMVYSLMFLTPCSVNLLMSMNTTPEMHQCNIFMSAFDQQIEVKKPLSYCGANIWNYILNKVNPKSAIGSLKKLIQNLFLLSNNNLFRWFRTCCCIIAPLIIMFSTCVYMCKLQMSEYSCMGICTYIHMYLKVHAGSLTCKDSALLHLFYVLHP